MANKGEKAEFYDALRRGDPQLRVLEEHVSTEGLPMVPVSVADEIYSMRAEFSLLDKMGIIRHPTSTQITNIPSEVTGQAIPALVAEEGAYQVNEPAFVLTAVTALKYGTVVQATEELLEDQALFQSWFPRACARRLALQENTRLYTTLAAGGTSGVHLAASHTLTEAQLWTAYNVMPDPWHEGAHVCMNRATAIVMRQFLVATPKMWSMDFELGIGNDGKAHWLEMPLHTNTNWTTIASAGDLVVIITMVNPEAVIWVERQALQIQVDPYVNILTGLTSFYTSSRHGVACPIPLAVVHVTDHA